jgi:hypothetical protein
VQNKKNRLQNHCQKNFAAKFGGWYPSCTLCGFEIEKQPLSIIKHILAGIE